MTDHKDFKRHVRERMKKTGESYTAARQHFVAKPVVHGGEPHGTDQLLTNTPSTHGTETETRMKLNVNAFWRHFDRRESKSHDILRRCHEFVSTFDNPGLLVRACAAMMAAPVLSAVTSGLRLSKGTKDVMRLFGKRNKVGDLPFQPPGSDHSSLWNQHGMPERFISQPYDLQMDTLREMLKFCDKRGLTLGVHGGSWYFPGATILVEFRRKDESGGIYGPRY